MKVLQELLDQGDLRRRGFSTFVALSYSVDLPWFEDHVARQLAFAGVHRKVILVDQSALDAALSTQVRDLVAAGLGYVVQGIRAGATFHPKAYLLVGPKEARLYVGSGNLNLGGLGRTREIFERFEARPGVPVPRAFGLFRKYVTSLLERSLPRTPHVEQAIGHAFASPSLGGPVDEGSPLLVGSPGSLLDEIEPPPTRASKLVLTAPFFDAGGEAVRTLASRFGASSYTVIVDASMTNLTEAGRRAILESGGRVVALADARPCHAKALYAEGDSWAISVHGSANLSVAAWRGHNAELVVVRRGERAREVGALLDALTTRDPTDLEWARVHARAAEAAPELDAADDAKPQLTLHSARWIDSTRVEIMPATKVEPETVLRLEGGRGARVLPLQLREGAHPIAADDVKAAEPGVVAARLERSGTVGPWILVHDPRALERAARGRTPLDDRIDRLIADRGRGDSVGEDFFDLLTAMIQLRGKSTPFQGTSRTAAGPTTGGGPDWRWTTPFEETKDGDSGSLSSTHHNHMFSMNPARLIERLLRGDARAVLGESADQSPEEDAEGDQERPPVGPTEPLAPPNGVEGKKGSSLDAAAERARIEFVRALETGEQVLPAEYLLADALLLAGALQGALREGRLLESTYQRSVTDMLSALLGFGHAPYPNALATIPGDQRASAWGRSWLLVGPLLLLWNVLLSRLASGRDEDVPDAGRRMGAAMWVRGVIRHAPSSNCAELLYEAERQLPAVEQFGVLWLGERWRYWSDRHPFRDFMRQVVDDAMALNALEPALQGVPRGERQLSGPLSEDDSVLGRGRDGHLAIGFMDTDTVALLCDGALQDASSSDPRRHLRKVGVRDVVPLERVEAFLKDAPCPVKEGLKVLTALAP